MALRVLFITSAYPTNVDDSRGTFIHVLARSLVEQGATVTVLAPGAPGALKAGMRDGVRIERVTYWIPRWQGLARGLAGIVPNLRARPWLVAQVPTLITALARRAAELALDVDVIHAHWVFPSGVAGVSASRRSGKPLVITSHGGDLNLAGRLPLLRPIVRSTVAKATHCIAVSRALVTAFESYGVPSDHISRLPCGTPLSSDQVPPGAHADADLQAFATASGLRILYVGSLIPRKSVGTLIQAVGIVRRAAVPVAVAIVGAGPELQVLQKQASEAQLEVRFVGERRPEEIAGWLSACDVLVLPSRSEGRPLIVLEALAMGRPVIGTDIPGTNELIADGATGFLFPFGNSEALASHLIKLGSTQGESERMGERALEWFNAEGLSAAAIGRRHIELYERLHKAVMLPGRLR